MDAYIGLIMSFGGSFAPVNWALCNGQLMAIAQNTALFSIIGTTFGGDGVSTFALPDLRGRIPVHAGSGPGLSPYDSGQKGGTETVPLITSQIPAHSHPVNASERAATADPKSAVYGNDTTNSTQIYAASSDRTVMNPGMVGPAGGSQPHPNIQPYTCANFIICLNGIFPARN